MAAVAEHVLMCSLSCLHNACPGRLLHCRHGAQRCVLGELAALKPLVCPTPPPRLVQAHAWLCAIGWGVLIPVGIVMARSFKELDPMWFHLHRGIQVRGRSGCGAWQSVVGRGHASLLRFVPAPTLAGASAAWSALCGQAFNKLSVPKHGPRLLFSGWCRRWAL